MLCSAPVADDRSESADPEKQIRRKRYVCGSSNGCGQRLLAEDFSPSVLSRTDGSRTCRECTRAYQREQRSANREAEENRNLVNALRRHNLTLEDYYVLAEAQNWCCSICERHVDELPNVTKGRPRLDGTEPENPRKLVVDHDHGCCPGQDSCGACVRGLLCSGCNFAIGLLGEDADRIHRAAAYVNRGGTYERNAPRLLRAAG